MHSESNDRTKTEKKAYGKIENEKEQWERKFLMREGNFLLHTCASECATIHYVVPVTC